MAKALATNGATKVYILGRRLEKLYETAKVNVLLFIDSYTNDVRRTPRSYPSNVM